MQPATCGLQHVAAHSHSHAAPRQQGGSAAQRHAVLTPLRRSLRLNCADSPEREYASRTCGVAVWVCIPMYTYTCHMCVLGLGGGARGGGIGPSL